MNSIEKLQALQGLSYNFHINPLVTLNEKECDALMKVRDIMRDAGLMLVPKDSTNFRIIRTNDNYSEIGGGMYI